MFCLSFKKDRFMNSRLLLNTATAVLLAVGGMASPALGAEPDEKGQEILEGLVAYLLDAGGFSFDSQLNFVAKIDDQTLATDSLFQVNYSGPDTASVHLKNKDVEIFTFLDPLHLTTYIPEFHQYIVEPQARSAAQIVIDSGWGPVNSTVAILSELLTAKPFSGALVSYEGEESVSGNKTHRLSVSHHGHDWTMWVDAGATPTIRRIAPDMTPFIQLAESQGVTVTIEVEAVFTRWNVAADQGDALKFSPPDDARLVRAFEPPHPLVGKPAPEFAIAIYGGGELDLAKKKDDEIYILDFWATWCGPCRKAMPVIASVSKEFADQGVKMFAVNLQDTDEQIAAFLNSSGLGDLVVPKDVTGAVQQMYQADKIPQTVIIGKSGNVEVVHQGFHPEMTEPQLRAELTALVAAEK
jgi:thiol-disulfide isomerase/thioredoxin